ncbi:Malectin/receptor protein kinase family protein [Hibiscus syriacus]|uniref:Malectin/receptor protein kinase family protein n=1 Tax=Hibiscus syriacus TaxID=106335 RepID=A0A6A3C0H1_HIBSY|nr:receptor-like protein kinase FERONIA [Hibiscus syriacus]KAE8722304.1 Malectin/receptor protein kinase family protein [Hibiscus syriacus]
MTDSSSSRLRFFQVTKKAVGFISRLRSQRGSSGKSYSTLPEELSIRQFSLAEIKAATANFDENLIIGTSIFGSVYKGVIDDGTFTVAIRRMELGLTLFRTEVVLLCQLNHFNVESLIGFCDEKGETILVYEYLCNRSLYDCLHGNVINANPLPLFPLPWEKRLEICIGAARGLHYLHTGTKYVVMHRNVTTNTILLDHDLVPKLSGFFVSKLGPRSMSKALIRKEAPAEGAFGYLDPEYYHTKYLSEKIDVYSFGVVLLEVILVQTRTFHFQMNNEARSLSGWTSWCLRNGTLYHYIDPYLKGRIAPECFNKFMEIAMCCISATEDERPSMGEVEVTLELALELQKKSESEMTSI